MAHWTELCSPMPDRVAGIPVEEAREKFYAMVRRYLAYERPVATRKGRKAKKPESSPTIIDGKLIEIEQYERGAKDKKRNNAADAVQWLAMNGHLRNPVPHGLALRERDRALEIAYKSANGRIDTASDLASIFETAELTPLRSPDFGATPGGSFGPRYVGVSKFRCIEIVAQLGEDIPPVCLRILRAVICENEFPWLGESKSEMQRIFAEIRTALDFARWSLDRRPGPIDIHERDTAELIERCPAAFEWLTMRKLRGVTLSTRRLATSKAR